MKLLKLLHWRLIVLFMLVIVISCVVTVFGQIWWSSVRPIPVTIHQIFLRKKENGSYRMDVETSGPATQGCMRFTQHLLYKDNNWAPREYVPLAASVNGSGFSPTLDFTAKLEIPSEIRGEWDYVNRTVYMCSIFPGLVNFIQTVSIARKINLE